MLNSFHEIAQTLSHNKLRTFLTGIAVTWGVFMLIVLLGAARGVTNSFERNMAKSSMARIVVWSGRTSIPYKGNREGRAVYMSQKDLRIIPEENARYVDDVTSRLALSGTVSTSAMSVRADLTGVYPNELQIGNRGNLIEGRFINQRDMRDKSKVMVLPQEFANQLFPPEGKKAVGGRVTNSGLSFLVVGVYESEWHRDIYIPFSTARTMVEDPNILNNINVNLRNVKTEQDGTAAEEGIRSTLSRAHGFDPKDDNAIYIANYFNNSLTAGRAMGILDTAVWALGILTLLTGIVGISNIMFVTVRERTHEIGIRRAIGAKPRQILWQVVTESVVITVLFGYIGIVLGMAVTQLFANVEGNLFLNPTVSLSIALEVTGVLVLSGALAGLFPALKALKIKPVEALMEE